MSSIFYHTRDSFSEEIFSELGKGRHHAGLLYAHFMRKGSLDGFEVEPNARALVEEILKWVDFSLPEVDLGQEEGGTVKFLTQVGDGLEVESVFIPMRAKSTLCISSQVGCKMGCAFCETGRMGLLKQLSAEQIVAQVFLAVHHFGLKIDNIVFMGMGEPLDNFDAVMRAIDVLTDSSGLAFGPSRISVSTSGIVDKIDAMAERADPAVNLAVSVNAPTDEIRRRIMPVNRTWGMAELKGAMERFCSHPRRQIFVEYVLLEGVNDSLECADLLADYLRGLKVKVNLIPYNPQSKDRFAPPKQEVMQAFMRRMQNHGYLTMMRGTKGQKIMAACGQLGNLQLRRKKSRILSE
ncbi:MAG: 23S rRNA (adenine(2503)-C(2))-methyltransferase RlmN [Simkaniaceae bacterium]|nr:23S rRNA (adenine(2503)-C(2))-methyltransferase RlmN [Candidatus Sacchlamyda saccharinae]